MCASLTCTPAAALLFGASSTTATGQAAADKGHVGEGAAAGGLPHEKIVAEGGGDGEDVHCSICQEVIEVIWDDQADDWIYKGAAKMPRSLEDHASAADPKVCGGERYPPLLCAATPCMQSQGRPGLY